MRLRLQFHLSTAWLMMCAAAVIVALNTRKRQVESRRECFCSMRKTIEVRAQDGNLTSVWDPSPIFDSILYEQSERGFPFTFQSCANATYHYRSLEPEHDYWKQEYRSSTYSIQSLLADIAVLACLVLLTCIGCEFLIRRRSRALYVTSSRN